MLAAPHAGAAALTHAHAQAEVLPVLILISKFDELFRGIRREGDGGRQACVSRCAVRLSGMTARPLEPCGGRTAGRGHPTCAKGGERACRSPPNLGHTNCGKAPGTASCACKKPEAPHACQRCQRRPSPWGSSFGGRRFARHGPQPAHHTTPIRAIRARRSVGGALTQ
jgi:hypothetical protein